MILRKASSSLGDMASLRRAASAPELGFGLSVVGLKAPAAPAAPASPPRAGTRAAAGRAPPARRAP